MADLLAADKQDWLLEALAGLVDLRGPQPLLESRLLRPDPSDFPDPFTPDERGVRVLLQRLLAHAGLDGLERSLETFSQPDELREMDERGNAKAWGHDGAAAWFAGIEGTTCHFGVAAERIADPEGLVATLCHEVAHTWREVHGAVVEDRSTDEQLTDVTTIYLGFGVLTTNGSYRYRASGGMEGTQVVTRWSHSRGGYLPPEAMSFLLAAQARARGLGWFERRRLASLLETNQAAYFRWALGRLPEAGALRARLRLGASAEG